MTSAVTEAVVRSRGSSLDAMSSSQLDGAPIGKLPTGWDVVQLREGASLESGQHVLARFCNSEGRGTPYLTGPADFPDGRIALTKYVTRPSKLCIANDILVTVKGSGVGKIVRADRQYCISRQLMAVRPILWSHDFLEYALRNSRTIAGAATGLIPGLSREDILNTQIALPRDIREQQAIANVLSDQDRLIDSLVELIAKKRAIKHGAMQDLLTGKRRLPGYNGEWHATPLHGIGEILNGLTYSPGDVSESGTLVLRSSNIQNDALCFDDNVFVQMDIPTHSMAKPNDILICVRNGSRDLIGKTAKLDLRCEGMAFGAFMAVLRSRLPDFVLYQFRSDAMKRQISEHLGATINQITNKSLKSFVISMPPTETEAVAVSSLLADMDTEITLHTEKLSKARQIKQGMTQELLTGRVRLV